MSSTAWARGFEVKFTEPERSDLFFKQKLSSFQQDWKEKFNWKLFKPLRRDDEHYLKTLRLPLTNEQKEFDELILALTKVFIDSLNEKELVNGIIIEKENPKGIDKLEAFLLSCGIELNEMIRFLRNLQQLRSTGVAHRKGENYEKVKKYFKIDETELQLVFDDILVKCIRTLNALETKFLLGRN